MDDRMVCSILVSAPGPLGFELIWGLGTKSLGPGLDNKGTPIDKDNLVRYSCNWSILVSAPGPLGFELIGGLGTKGLGPRLDNKGTLLIKITWLGILVIGSNKHWIFPESRLL